MTEHLYMYEVHVERVGRSVKDQTWAIEIGPCHPLNVLDHLSEEIYKRARRHLLSNDVSVEVVVYEANTKMGTWREVLEGCATAPTTGKEANR